MTITREQLLNQSRENVKALELAVVQNAFKDVRPAIEIDLELARIALASLEAERVAVNDDMAYAFHHALSDSSLGTDEVEEIKTGLCAAFANVADPQSALVVMQDHQLRELVNKLRDIAVDYHGTQQLRERIAHAVRAAMQGKAEPVSLAKTEIVKHWYMVSWIAQGGRHGSTEVWFDHPWMRGDMLDVTKSIAELNNVTGLVIVSALPIAAAPQQESK